MDTIEDGADRDSMGANTTAPAQNRGVEHLVTNKNFNQTSETLTKRMLEKKINFNYHPILEYIPYLP